MFDSLLARLGLSPAAPTVPAPSHPPAVTRALSMVGRGKYRLGAGGKHGDAPTPFDETGFCDCSGFISWCSGKDRKQPWGWIWTNGLVADARGKRQHVTLVDIGSTVQPGDLVVYAGGEAGGPKVGHVGIVVAVPDGWAYSSTADLARLRVVHCAASHAPGGGAVRESDGSPWRRRGIVARWR